MDEYQWPVRIYYEDTDSGGVVYHANYLNFMERARTEWLRQLGIEQDELINNIGVLFAVKNVSIDYQRAARFNDLLQINTKLLRVSGASLELNQIIINSEKNTVVCEAIIKVVSLNKSTFKPCALPTVLLTKLKLVNN